VGKKISNIPINLYRKVTLKRDIELAVANLFPDVVEGMHANPQFEVASKNPYHNPYQFYAWVDSWNFGRNELKVLLYGINTPVLVNFEDDVVGEVQYPMPYCFRDPDFPGNYPKAFTARDDLWRSVLKRNDFVLVTTDENTLENQPIITHKVFLIKRLCTD